jgi:SagB-type dehydrogenase family enzyme
MTAMMESALMRSEHDLAVPPLRRSELWSLREDVTVETAPGDGPLRLRGRWGSVVVERPTRMVRDALERMRLGPVSLENVIGGSSDEHAAAASWAELHRTISLFPQLIIRSLSLDTGQPLLSVVPLTVRSTFGPVPLDPDVPIRLSIFARLRTDGTTYVLESPLAVHRVVLHRAQAVMLTAALAGPVTPAALAAGVPELGPLTADAAEYLAAAGMVVQAAGAVPAFAEDTDPALAGWSPVDLEFHTSSTLGLHDRDVGITYPLGLTRPPEPVVKPPSDRQYVQLHRPRWQELDENDPPLTAVLEGRRSTRRHGANPITVTELGELLYRTARIRALYSLEPADEEVPAAPGGGYELSDRPYPSGGRCYELELYATAGDCAGLAPGIYHYDPLGHRLEQVSTSRAAVDELLGCARVAADMDSPPQVLISMTARFGRLSWKYEGVAYRLVLNHVGVLMQNLYLVCTAMRLAACALGTVSLTAAARAFGADWLVEPCVGQFVVGREPATPDHDTRPWRAANDAEWADLARAALRDA